MLNIDLAALEADLGTRFAATRNVTFVIDVSMNVVLRGASGDDLVPIDPPASLDADLRATAARVVREHDFAREPIARAVTAEKIAVCMAHVSGPAGDFYAIMTAARRIS
jgi:hypothetical protein